MLDLSKNVISDVEEFLEKISPLYHANKLSAILIQLPPSFTIASFNLLENFLEKLPRKSESISSYSNDVHVKKEHKKGNKRVVEEYQYALEFRHPSWETEGPWELLKNYNIATVITDSPEKENLSFLSNSTVNSSDHSFIRFHGRNTTGHYWYNYLYTKKELKPWIEKVRSLRNQIKILRIYFNNHYGGKAVINALQFKEMNGMSLRDEERKILHNAENYYQIL